MARTVLFSNPNLAAYINQNFEPCWQSVRSVPTVTIDFGNGKSVKRTLNGNIATYVCSSDGKILDIIPGLYEPKSYQDRLEQLVMLHRFIDQLPIPQRQEALAEYHGKQLNRMLHGKSPLRLVEHPRGLSSPVELTSNTTEQDKEWTKPLTESEAYRTIPLPKGELAQWQQLSDDVRFNETVMRKKVQAILASEGISNGTPTVPQLTKWLYREVLHADIDDPYLGLAPVLNGTYPFDRAKTASQ